MQKARWHTHTTLLSHLHLFYNYLQTLTQLLPQRKRKTMMQRAQWERSQLVPRMQAQAAQLVLWARATGLRALHQAMWLSGVC